MTTADVHVVSSGCRGPGLRARCRDAKPAPHVQRCKAGTGSDETIDQEWRVTMSEVAINAPNLLASRDAGPLRLAAHRACRRSEEVLHGLGRRPCQRAGRPVGRSASTPKYTERLPRIITDEHGVQWRYCEGYRPDRAARHELRRRGPGAQQGRRRCRSDRIRRPRSRRRRRRADLPQQGPGDVGDARSGVRHGAVPGVERLGVGAVRRRTRTA